MSRSSEAGAVSRASILQVYRRYAPVYDLIFGASLGAGRKSMARMVEESSPRTLLEIGVGTGLALDLYPRSCRVTAVDLCPNMLARAKRRALKMQETVPFLLRADGEQMPFQDHQFECVTVPYVLSVTPDPTRLMSEIVRVCVPGGVILVLNHFSGARGWRWAERVLSPLATRVGFRSRLDFSVLERSKGISIEAIERHNFLGLSTLVRMRSGV